MIAELELASVFISHDLSLIRYMCDRTAIMYRGRFVEFGPTEEVIMKPRHPYTSALLSAAPVPDPEHRYKLEIEGEAADPILEKEACRFAPRCQKKKDICLKEPPVLKEVAPDHLVECHLY